MGKDIKSLDNYVLIYAYDFDDESGYFDYCTIFKHNSTGHYVLVPDEIFSVFRQKIENLEDYELVSRGTFENSGNNVFFKF